MKESDNVLRILEETKVAIEKDDPAEIKELSNQTINTAAYTQDSDNILVAVVVYSLSKILERENYKKYPDWNNFYKIMINSLNSSIEDIKKKDEKKFRHDFKTIRRAIGKLSGKFKDYIREVFRKALINKASRIYEHGISMEQTAKLLGITQYELADYAGKTGISDVPESQTMNVKQRIKLAKEFFG